MGCGHCFDKPQPARLPKILPPKKNKEKARIMPVLAADAKFQLKLSSTPALPSVADFELNNILTKVVQTELNCVKASLIDSKNQYQKDIRGELRHSLLSEQKIQHKNIDVLKLASSLADRLSKSRKRSAKSNDKCFDKSASKGSGTSKVADMKVILVKAASASHRARNILKRCSNLSDKCQISSAPIDHKIPLIKEFLDNAKSKSKPCAKAGSHGDAHDVDGDNSLNSHELSDEFEPEDYQSILETNIARYRENINAKNSHRDILNVANVNDDKSLRTVDSRTSDFVLSKRPSLSTFSSSKSTATVFETNLNSVHKKLRINPHPLAIYNNPNSSTQLGEEGKAFGELSLSRNEKFNSSSEPNGPGGPLCGASEILYLKLLLLTENGSSSSGSDNGTTKDNERNTRQLQSQSKDEEEEVSNHLSHNLTRNTDHLFSFHPVQKHTPLHHTHRPTQSILKKPSSSRIKSKASVQISDQAGIEELLTVRKTSSNYDSSLSDFSATGYFVPRTESSAPILTSLEGLQTHDESA